MQKIAVFDLDGTLAQTESYWIPVLKDIFSWVKKEFKLEPSIKNTRDILSLLGKPDEEIYSILFPGQKYESIQYIIAEGRKIWQSRIENFPYQLYDGAEEVLQFFNGGGWKLFIASNCDSHYLKALTSETRIKKYFEGMVCATDYPGLSKSEFTSKVLDGYKWEKGIFVGDSILDMMAGRENGLITVWAKYGYASQPDQEFVDYSIEKISDLLLLEII